MRTPVAPFLTISDEVVEHQEWEIQVRESLVPLPNLLTDWDYQATIRIVANVRIDGPRLLDDAALLESSEVALVVIIHSSNTKVQRSVFQTAVPLGSVNDLVCDLSFGGDDLGDRLTITTLVVATDPNPADPLGAAQPSSILWRSSRAVSLEGDGSQFPTDAEDFGVTRPKFAYAGWYLSIDQSDWDAQFVSAVRLTLNSGLKPIQRLLAGAEDGETKLLLRALDSDITRQLIQAAFESDEVVGAEPDFDSTTLRGVLRTLIAQLWPTSSVLTLQNHYRDRPQEIELAVQNARRFPS